MILPTMDTTGWTILDFELALSGLRLIDSACTALLNQPRASHDHEHHPGAAFIAEIGEGWCSGRIDELMERLSEVRFADPAHDERRVLLLVNYASAHGCASDSLASIIQMALEQSVRPAI